MTRHLNRALPFASWPQPQRERWKECFDSIDIFDDNPAAGLSDTTVASWRAAYGQWLGYLETLWPDFLDLPAKEQVTLERVEGFVEYLRENCRDTTINIEICRLFYTLRTTHPDHDWDWLYRIGRRIAKRAIPLKHPAVFSGDLYALGLNLMDRAVAKTRRASRVTKSAAMMYRDGMLVATLVTAPMRRGTLSKLKLDEHLRKVHAQWLITVPAELTKTRRSQIYPLSERMSEAMEVYLARFRPAFPGSDQHDGLWPYIGRPMTDKMIRRRTIRWTEGWLGVPVSPHRFRNAAANFILVADPEKIRVAKDLLGHKSFAMTEKHYIDAAQSRIAGRTLQSILSRVNGGGNANM